MMVTRTHPAAMAAHPYSHLAARAARVRASRGLAPPLPPTAVPRAAAAAGPPPPAGRSALTPHDVYKAREAAMRGRGEPVRRVFSAREIYQARARAIRGQPWSLSREA